MDKPAVVRMLQTLPADLNETYDRILQNIPAPRISNAIKLLQLLIFSKRPMELGEVVDAVATEPDSTPPFDAENRVAPPDAITGYCSSLLKITREVGDVPRLQLAHFSVKEYLISARKENPHHERFEEKVANGTITRIFVAYLWTAAEDQEGSRSARKFPLAKYAAFYWLKHATVAGESEDGVFVWMDKIFTHPKLLHFSLALHNPDTEHKVVNSAVAYRHLYLREEQPVVGLPSALYCAALCGLDRSVDLLLSKGFDPNACSGYYGNALQAACSSAHIRTAEVLLNHCAEVNARGGFFTYAIHAAVFSKNLQMVGLLLTRGANVNAGARYGPHLLRHTRTALHMACSAGHLEMITILLDNKANVNAEVGLGGSVFLAAASKGYSDVVEILLRHGADVHARNKALSQTGDGAFYTALEAACCNGHTRVVQLLLEKNPDVNVTSRKCGTPLTIASAMGHIEIVHLLLKKGANVDVIGGDYGFALHAASLSGQRAVLKLLLNRNANIDLCDKSCGTALQAAANKGDLELMRLLIVGGANVNLQSRVHGTALHAAAKAGMADAVKLLLQNRADVDLNCENHGCALDAATLKDGGEVLRILIDHGASLSFCGGRHLLTACKMGLIDIVRSLIDRGVDVNYSGFFGSPLHEACRLGDLKILEILSSKGADINRLDGRGLSAFYYAWKSQHLDVVRMLLANGARIQGSVRVDSQHSLIEAACHVGDIELMDLMLNCATDIETIGEELGSALQRACNCNNREMVELLIGRDADINLRSQRYGSALQAACNPSSNIDLIQLLLDNDADTNIQGGEYGNALCAASYYGLKEAVLMLLKRGADVHAQAEGYGNALQATCCDELQIQFDPFLPPRYVDVDEDEDCATSHCGADTETFDRLLRPQDHHAIIPNPSRWEWFDFDVNVRDEEYGNALCAASEAGHLSVVQTLIDWGADVNAQGGKYDNALMAAVHEGCKDVAELLLEKGAEVNARCGSWENALRLAIWLGHTEIALMLLERDANFKSQGEDWDEALDPATSQGRKDILEVLVEGRGINVFCFDRINAFWQV